MAKKAKPLEKSSRRKRPARTPEERNNQLIALAYDLVEQRLLDGSATAQETTHFLKLGSSKNRLEEEKLKKENELLRAKTEAIESNKRIEELYSQAIEAMRRYNGDFTSNDNISNEDDL